MNQNLKGNDTIFSPRGWKISYMHATLSTVKGCVLPNAGEEELFVDRDRDNLFSHDARDH